MHVPFCTRVCPYCDFAVTRYDTKQAEAYVGALCKEARRWRATVAFDTIYLGGGTPTALSDAQLQEILGTLRARFSGAETAEVTLEANPEDITRERLATWRTLGIDRLSLGVQALDDTVLKRLGRRHRRALALAAIERTTGAGFSVSVDLMFSVPGLELRRWRDTLHEVSRTAIRHLSCYELTIHEGTPYARLRRSPTIRLPGQDERREAFVLTHRLLGELGFEAYEVSNFARTAADRSRHNQKYWEHAPYLGLGPSAHSFDGRHRWWNLRDAAVYHAALERQQAPVADGELLDREARRLETLMLRLRTVDGLDLEAFAERFAERLEETRAAPIRRHVSAGTLRLAAGRLRPTVRGLAIADTLARDLV